MSSAVDHLPGMKERELASLGPCAVCRRPLTEELLFYVVTIRCAAFDAHAVRQRIGFQMTMGGSAALAQVLGPDLDLAKILAGPTTVAVHEHCADKIQHLLMLMGETDGQ